MADSAYASFWDARYSSDVTPWDAGRVPAALKAFADDRPPSARVLIPGCGSGHEAAYLHERRWDVLAIDFSSAAIARAAAVLGPDSPVLREADFFDLSDEPFDVIYSGCSCAHCRRGSGPHTASRWRVSRDRGGC